MGTTFRLQANALIRKNAVYQRRSICINIVLLSAPVFFCLLLFVMQTLINSLLLSGSDMKCGCKCLQCCPPNNGAPGYNASACYEASGYCPYKCFKKDSTKCGFRYSSYKQSVWCPILHPATYPAILQLPESKFRAPQWRPDVPIFYTADTPQVAAALGPRLVPPVDPLRIVTALADYFTNPPPTANDSEDQPLHADLLTKMGITLGSSAVNERSYYTDSAFNNPDEYLEVLMPAPACTTLGFSISKNSTFSEFLVNLVTNKQLLSTLNPADRKQFQAAIAQLPAGFTDINSTASSNSTGGATASSGDADASDPSALGLSLTSNNPLLLLSYKEVQCRDVYQLGQASVGDIDRRVFCGFYEARCDRKPSISSYPLAYNFRNTSKTTFAVDVIYNDTGRLYNDGGGPSQMQRQNLAFSMAVNSWIKWALGGEYSAELEGMMSTPKKKSKLSLDFSSLLGPLFYCWVVQLLLPVSLLQLVYEKEKRLRMMMKMHGLGDAAYWGVTYLWYFALYTVYIVIYLVFGSAVGLNIFRVNSYGIQIIFYLLCANCQIAFAFLLSCFFTSSRTAVVVAFLYVFGSGLIGNLLLEQFMAKNYTWMFFVQWIPAFSLYRGLYELAQYSFLGVFRQSDGMLFKNLSDPKNGMPATWGIFVVEWVLFMVLAWYLEQVYASGTGIRRSPLFFLDRFRTQVAAHPRTTKDAHDDGALVALHADVAEERARVEALQDFSNHPIVVQDLKKIYPAADGAPPKVAVRSLSLAVERGECFGLLGPNGAGKSTSINMMTGFLEPTAGTTIVAGYDIRRSISEIYKLMGVCPQHDLLWDTLTAREHLLFYGRLKGLTGSVLQDAVREALAGVNLVAAANNVSKKYSGGMKRRLSVAISFVGAPEVVYLDEPSTGLDPASRRNLWEVVRSSKRGRGIILTTHSMEEAEVLCDRLGIFVDGQLVCIGNPKEITSRYGSYYVFSIQVPHEQELAAQALVARLSPGSRLTYSVGGAMKFELPKNEVTLSAVFAAMQKAPQQGLQVLDWCVANATLEEVFIKFARQIGATTTELEAGAKKGITQ